MFGLETTVYKVVGVCVNKGVVVWFRVIVGARPDEYASDLSPGFIERLRLLSASSGGSQSDYGRSFTGLTGPPVGGVFNCASGQEALRGTVDRD